MVEQPSALADQQHQATPAVVVVLVLLEVLGQVGDALGQDRHLNLRRTGVTLGCGVLVDDLLLGCSVDRHSVLLSVSRCAAPPVPDRAVHAGVSWELLNVRGRSNGGPKATSAGAHAANWSL